MNNKLTHFAIHIDDIERAKSFYDGVSRPEIGLHDLPCKQYEKIR
jgi:predicted enzyme related to lactoylglutathione lyase